MPGVPRSEKLLIAPRYLLILLLPVLVHTASEVLLSTFGNTDVRHGPIQIIADPQMAELTGRYTFLAVFFFYSAVGITLVGIFAAELWSRHSPRSILQAMVGVVGLITVSLLFSKIEPEWMGSFEAYQLLGAEIFETALGGGLLPLCVSDAPPCLGRGAFFAMTFLMDKTNLISSLAVTAIIMGMVLALAQSGKTDLSSPEGLLREGAELEAAQATTRRYLYCSGVLLSIGMMLGLAWMLWPADLLADGTQQTKYRDLVQAVSLYRGVSYSVLILSYYMPVSLILMVRIERFHAAAKASGMDPVAADIKGFDIDRIGSLDAFKAILSIVSPIIASAVGSFTGLNVFG